MSNHHQKHQVLLLAYQELLSEQDRELLDPVRDLFEKICKNFGPAASVEVVYALGRVLAGKNYGRKHE